MCNQKCGVFRLNRTVCWWHTVSTVVFRLNTLNTAVYWWHTVSTAVFRLNTLNTTVYCWHTVSTAVFRLNTPQFSIYSEHKQTNHLQCDVSRKLCRPFLWRSHRSVYWVVVLPFLAAKRMKREAEHSPNNSAEMQHHWSCTQWRRYILEPGWEGGRVSTFAARGAGGGAGKQKLGS